MSLIPAVRPSDGHNVGGPALVERRTCRLRSRGTHLFCLLGAVLTFSWPQVLGGVAAYGYAVVLSRQRGVKLRGRRWSARKWADTAFDLIGPLILIAFFLTRATVSRTRS